MFWNDYRELFDALQDGIYCLDKALKVSFWNKGAEGLSGLPFSKVKGRHISQVLTYLDEKGSPIEDSGYAAHIALNTQEICIKRYLLRLPSTETIPIYEKAHPVFKNNQIKKVLVVFRRLLPRQTPCEHKGLIQICAWCKKIHCPPNHWVNLETYLTEAGLGVFTHGMCPDCASKIFEKKVYLESYQRVCKAISSSVSLKEVFDLIVKNVVKVMNVKASMLRLINKELNRLEVAAYYGLSERYVNKGPVDCDKSVVDTMEGKTVSIYDIASDPYAKYKKEAQEEGISSILSVPIKTGSDIIGILRMYTDKPVQYTDEDLKFITALAEQAAIAITNARTFESTVSRAKDYLRVFKEVTRAVSSTLELNEVLDLIVKKLPETMNLKGATVRLLEEDGRRLRLVAAHGLSDWYLNKGPVDMEENVKVALQKGVVAIYDVSTDPRVIYKEEAAKEGIKSMFTLPIVAKGKVIGIIRLFSSEHRTFTEEDIDFTASLAEVCGAAIDNARIYEQLKKESQTKVND